MPSFNFLSQPPDPSTSFRARQREALRNAWQHWSTNWRDVFRGSPVRDLLASITVAAVALPLNVALAVAAGLPPTAGLVAGAIGGGLAAIFGGAPLSVAGPAAALNLIVLGIFRDFGAEGVAAAALLVGLAELLFAFTLAGRLVRQVPEAVLAGFLTGVGLTLLNNQIPEVLGFNYRIFDLPSMMTRPAWLHDVSWLAVAAGLFVAFLVVTTAQYRRFPAAIVGIGLITFVAVYLDWDIERVGAVPASLPPISLPSVPAERWLALLARVAPLALLCAAESLLSARAVDRMSGRSHDSNLEMFGQGLANLGAGLMSGMPVTGVIVRSGVNVQSGARTRLSSLCHALLLIFAVLYLSDSIAQVPLTALAGFLCVIAFRLIELRTLVHLLQTAWIEAAAFLAAAIGTATDHLFIGLTLGVILHSVHLLVNPARPRDHVDTSDDPKVRAVIEHGLKTRSPPARSGHARADRPQILDPTPAPHPWLDHIRDRPHVPPTAFIHPRASVIGRVVLGDDVHVAAGTSLRADEGSPFFIGPGSNVQDGVILHALKDRCVRVGGQPWAIYVGRNVSIAHDALVHGPCYIGDDTFIGFKAVVHDSVIGARCSIGIGAVVVGVELPDGVSVPHGTIVDSADAVDRLAPSTSAHAAFNHDVVEVNRGLAAAYHRAHGENYSQRATQPPPSPHQGPLLMLLLGVLLGLALLALLLAGASVFRVDEGHVVVLTRFGAVRRAGDALRLYGPGLHTRAPWDRVLVVPIHEQTLAFVGEHDGHRIMTSDGTLLRFDCAVRWVPVVPALDRLLFDLSAPVAHIKDLFACILRAEVAAFEAKQDTGSHDWIRHAGSYATIRSELGCLRTRIETACRERIGERYGVAFIAVDIVDILPPDDLADGLNAVIQAEAESAAAFFRAQGECQQRTLSAHSGVAIARAHALAAETELRTLGHHLGELARGGTLADYVARRRDETYAECRTVFLKDPT